MQSSFTLLEHFPKSIFYMLIPFQSSGSQESNASNHVRFGAEMRKIWPSQDNYIQLISIWVGIPSGQKCHPGRIPIRVENPSGCRHFHPDVSHPEFGYPYLHPAPHPPPDDIRNLGSGWERRRFNFIRQTYPDGKGGVSTSSISHVRILYGVYPDHSKLKAECCTAAVFS